MAFNETRNQCDQDCKDNEQEQDEDGFGSRNTSSGFSHNHPSHPVHHRSVHVQTSCNNGGAVVLAESSIDRQIDYNETNHNQERRPVKLVLTISKPLRKKIQFALAQEKQRNNHDQQVLSQSKLKASNLFAFFLRIGSWKWESKNRGDLVVKFYYGKKKLAWEFLFGSMKKKIEIKWSDLSAINTFVDENKNERLEIELRVPPQFYKESKFQRLKHTQWESTDDFTQGQAQHCGRHTILFSPGVLKEPFKKLLKHDNRLYNLTQQPFPNHNSLNPSFEFSNNITIIYGSSSVPDSNHVQNLVQPTNSFVGHSGSNIRGLLTFPNSNEIACEVSCVKERTNSCVWEQSGINRIQETPLPPIIENGDNEIFKKLEPIVSDKQLELHHVDNQNLGEANYGLPKTDDLHSSGGVMNHMSYIDDDVSCFADQQFNDGFAIHEPCPWLSSQFNMHGYNEDGCNDLTLKDSNVVPSNQEWKTINPNEDYKP